MFAQPSRPIEYLEYLEMSLVPRGCCVCSEFGTVLLENELFSLWLIIIFSCFQRQLALSDGGIKGQKKSE